MRKFDEVLEEIDKSLKYEYPEIKDTVGVKGLNTPEVNTPVSKRNENNQGKVAGKYFKGLDNQSGKVVSDEDKKEHTQKGFVRRTLDQAVKGYSRVMSEKTFDKLFNDAGDRSLNFTDDGQWKSLNSKTGEYRAKKLPNGKIKIRKTPQQSHGQ